MLDISLDDLIGDAKVLFIVPGITLALTLIWKDTLILLTNSFLLYIGFDDINKSGTTSLIASVILTILAVIIIKII